MEVLADVPELRYDVLASVQDLGAVMEAVKGFEANLPNV
jgi:hypothetical protein